MTHLGYAARPATLSALIQGLQLQQAHAQGALAEKHNAFVDYVLALLFCATGHRPVRDPFQHLDHCDLDEGLMLISDKVVREARAWRLVALPPLAAEQLRLYLEHLQRLASGLERQSLRKCGALARDIRDLAARRKVQMPLFFYLEQSSEVPTWSSITPDALETRWADFWSLPVNFLRHQTAQLLWGGAGHGQWQQIQMGHFESLHHPMGITATESPRAVLQQIGEHLDRGLRQMGWTLQRGPLRHHLNGPGTAVSGSLSESVLGLDHRAQARQRRQARMAQVVRGIIAEVMEGEDLATMPRDAQMAAIEGIAAAIIARGGAVNQALRLLYRYLEQQDGLAPTLARMTSRRELEAEASPFTESTLAEYREVQRARRDFVAELEEQGRRRATLYLPRRIAEIVVAAALFGGLARADLLKALPSAMLTRAWSVDQAVFVDIPLTDDESGPVFRWHPDPVSRALLVGAMTIVKKQTVPDPRSIEAETRSIVGLQGRVSPWDRLAKLATVAGILELPGYLAAISRGDIATVSLPLPQYTRLIRDSALLAPAVSPGSQTPELTDDAGYWQPELPRRDGVATHPVEVKVFLSAMRAAYAQAASVPVSGRASRKRLQKTALIDALKSHFGESGDWSETMLLVVAWIVHLCREGTRRKKQLAYSTVAAYGPMVARALARVAGDVPFLSLDAGEQESLYLRALESVDEASQPRLAGRLLELHAFLMDRYAVDGVDWTAIWAQAGRPQAQSLADANHLSISDYLPALQWVLQDHLLPQRLRYQYGGLLLLGFRFGLRFGESWTLQYRQIQHDETLDRVWLTLRESAHGALKTASAVRVVRLLETLEGQEREVLRVLLAMGEMDFAQDELSPLMAHTPGRRELISRHRATAYLHAVLRHAAGDPAVRYHHLRHSWATRMVFQWAMERREPEEMDKALLPKQINRSAWEGFIGPERGYPLRCISTALGHAQPTTTLASYIHSADRLLYHALKKAGSWPVVKDLGIAYSYGVGEGTIAQWRYRHPQLGASSEAMLIGRRGDAVPKPTVVTTDRPSGLPVEMPRYNETVSVRLDDVEKLIRLAAQSLDRLDRYGLQIGLPEEQMKLILSTVRLCERLSGFDRYRLTDHGDDPILSSAAETYAEVGLNFATENRRVRQMLGDLEKAVLLLSDEQKKEMATGLTVWAHTYVPGRRSHLVTELAELHALELLWRNLKLSKVDRLMVASNIPGGDALEANLVKLGYKVARRSISFSHEKLAVRRQGRIEVWPEVSTRTDHRDMQRALFVLLVAQEAGALMRALEST